MKRHRSVRLACAGATFLLLGTATAASAQEPAQRATAASAGDPTASLGELQAVVRELHSALIEMRAEMVRSRAEAGELRQELQTTRERLASVDRDLEMLRTRPAALVAAEGSRAPESRPGTAITAETVPASTEERLARLQEDQQLLSGKIDEQYQTKVESGSKYRVRLSGLALLNLFGNRGAADNADVPSLARPRDALESGGSFGATVRQSSLGLEMFGPKLGEVRTSADMQFDFFGGFPGMPDGVTAGLIRMRTAKVRFAWQRTSLVAGQDAPFFSPLSPTSLASIALPALAYSGNLWTWTPQVRVERRLDLSDTSNVLLQAGILDPLTGEPPNDPFYRAPQGGESSRQPAYAARVALTSGPAGRAATLGGGGYYSRQSWGFGRSVDAWAGTADWSVPLGRNVFFTGEFYRGRGIGGLGGGLGRSVLFSGPPTSPASAALGLNAAGGWAQLKFRPTEKLEFNGAFGEDYSLPADLRRFAQSQSYIDASLERNESAFVNGIYRLRSNLLLSLEYRHLRTSDIYLSRQSAAHVNVGIGVLF